MKSTLVKITPDGMDPEFMVVTTDSSAHEFIKDYAKDNGYPIEEHACANRFQCILQDLKRIEETIQKYAPVILGLPAFDNGKQYNDHLSQCFTNIEIACNEEMDDPEFAWMQPELPTYEEYVKGMTLQQQLEMYYDKDIDGSSYEWTCEDIAKIVNNADWLPEFEQTFKDFLKERQYIR